jgi:hypothetical protein
VESEDSENLAEQNGDAAGEAEDGASGPDSAESVKAVAPLQRSSAGGSGSFLVRADDGCQYWCKVLNNTQNSQMVPVNEQIVARLGQLLDIAVCEPKLVEIPAALAGWEFRPGHVLEAGWAHGGLAVQAAVETRALDHRDEDENASRHAGFFALHDWLGGADPQWLYSAVEANSYYSHDHGHYFWGPDWTGDTLDQREDDPSPLGLASQGLDAAEIARLADGLAALSEQDIRDALPNFPEDWPISSEMIDAVVHFATHRREDAAGRLRGLPT